MKNRLIICCWFGALVGVALSICDCAATPGQVATDVTVGLNGAICVLNTVPADEAAGQSEAQAIADAVVKCGLTAAQTAGLLDAHKKAEALEAKKASK